MGEREEQLCGHQPVALQEGLQDRGDQGQLPPAACLAVQLQKRVRSLLPCSWCAHTTSPDTPRLGHSHPSLPRPDQELYFYYYGNWAPLSSKFHCWQTCPPPLVGPEPALHRAGQGETERDHILSHMRAGLTGVTMNSLAII